MYLSSFPNYAITEGYLRQYLHPTEVPRVVQLLQDTTFPKGLPCLTVQCQEPGGDTRRSAVRPCYEIHNPVVRPPVYGGLPLLGTPPSLAWLKLVSCSFPVPQTLNTILIILSRPLQINKDFEREYFIHPILG